jgi:hypothetical protein
VGFEEWRRRIRSKSLVRPSKRNLTRAEEQKRWERQVDGDAEGTGAMEVGGL